MFQNAEISQAVRSIYRCLQNRLMNTYGIDDIDTSFRLADSILSIQGLNKDRFSIIKQVEQLLVGKLNDCSIDENSNKNDKTIRSVLREAQSPIDKIIGYRFLYRQIGKMYGKKEAKRLTALMYDYTLCISDSTSLLIPYCWAFDASKVVTFGKPFGQLPSKPVKRLDSYISLLNEVIHTMSNHLAGAIAVGTFFIDIAHVLLMKEGKTIEDLGNTEYRKYITNQYQKFVHGVNSLSRSGGVESPFTNVSLFDREKLKKLVEEYQWYFSTELDENDKFTQIEDSVVIEFIIELQNIFMDFFDKGDPSTDGLPYRFPVATLNISKSQDEQGNWVIEDQEFLKSCCKKDIYRYNIFVSQGDKICSCCRLLSSPEMLELASQSNSFGAGGSVSLGSHRVLTINFMRLALLAKDRNDFFNLLATHVVDAKKILHSHKELIRSLKDNQLFLRLGWINLDRLFSTIGLLGYVECAHILNQKGFIEENEDILYEILVYLNTKVNENNEEFPGCVFNLEQIPGESMSYKLANADKLLFGEKAPFSIYANQFVPLWDNNLTIWEKMEKDGKYNSLLTGGGISHINTGEHITSKQAQKLIEYAVKSKCEHFAITGTFCKCENGHVTIGNKDVCGICGGIIETKIARTVGFFTPIEDWNFNKIEYDFKRRKEYINGDFN